MKHVLGCSGVLVGSLVVLLAGCAKPADKPPVQAPQAAAPAAPEAAHADAANASDPSAPKVLKANPPGVVSLRAHLTSSGPVASVRETLNVPAPKVNFTQAAEVDEFMRLLDVSQLPAGEPTACSGREATLAFKNAAGDAAGTVKVCDSVALESAFQSAKPNSAWQAIKIADVAAMRKRLGFGAQPGPAPIQRAEGDLRVDAITLEAATGRGSIDVNPNGNIFHGPKKIGVVRKNEIQDEQGKSLFTVASDGKVKSSLATKGALSFDPSGQLLRDGKPYVSIANDGAVTVTNNGKPEVLGDRFNAALAEWPESKRTAALIVVLATSLKH